MRVAFTMIGSQNWTGGYNYLLNLLTILGQHEKNHITPVLFVGNSVSKDVLADFADKPFIELVQTSLLDETRRIRSILQAVFLGRDIALNDLFKKLGIDVVFESAQFFGWRLDFPCIAWIPDFQHKKLPHLFSRRGWWKREIGFRLQVASGRTIMLSSDDARYACETYYPSSKGRTNTVHFAVPSTKPENAVTEARAIADAYHLPKNYFFMPNQFWRHKNHELVINALSLLKQRNKHVVVAASGKQVDPRAPKYFPEFQEKLKQSGLEDQFRLLGMVPYSDLRSLMQASTALLNPSLFEGWSTTVEEARSIGVPMLLSNLDVHREQMGEEASYFDPHCAQSLADNLERFPPFDHQQRINRLNTASTMSSELTKQFAHNFVEMVKNSVHTNPR